MPNLRQIIPCTDPLMRTISTAVEDISPEIQELAEDMIMTMLAVDGAGLAAVQVGVPLRLFVMLDLPGATTVPQREHLRFARKLVLVNPVMVDHSDDQMELVEGCLSMPDVFFPVKRWREVTLEYSDLKGTRQTIHGKGYSAVALQHELDHLDGIRNIDRVSRLKRDMLLKSFRDSVKRRKQRV